MGSRLQANQDYIFRPYLIHTHTHIPPPSIFVCKCLWRPEVPAPSGIGVVGSWELPEVGTGNRTLREKWLLNNWALSLGPSFIFLTICFLSRLHSLCITSLCCTTAQTKPKSSPKLFIGQASSPRLDTWMWLERLQLVSCFGQHLVKTVKMVDSLQSSVAWWQNNCHREGVDLTLSAD